MIYVDHCCLLVIFSINNLTYWNREFLFRLLLLVNSEEEGTEGVIPLDLDLPVSNQETATVTRMKSILRRVFPFTLNGWPAQTCLYMIQIFKPSLTGGMRLQWKRIWFWFKYHSTKHNPYDMQLNTFNLGQVPMIKKILFVVHVYTKNRKIGI